MTTPRNEQETILSYDRELDQWHYYSDVPKHNRKYRYLVQNVTMTVEENGDITRMEGTINGSVSIRKHTVMSEETRAKAAARLKAYRDKKVEEEK
ncbi:hypothetical protein [Furfurilactobacillus milii]|uniref:Uncharacterized protein n=1 Tax=Furfurilactobacillus milii TaxID=2888272 RepID=A0ABT6DFA8_9LACO|nr:hypothetical protein [Furfurilactobacillus milii]QLE66952.1 hypothetical protein LROSL2_1602 [Furfurilactobacillus rossiae]MCF6161961.1 hypothetical protein [Furfurilactobacillus milii]MCF6164341.1 hypothetical protein [Furfurilactobacillus milii]MDF9914829.1 hypothetical protein [Furfurilactobacillus milii]QLE69382.1 hypothetical protein LROSL3_1603 [Furfurilactobacillus rossiae]